MRVRPALLGVALAALGALGGAGCAAAGRSGQGGGEVRLRCTPADAAVALDGVPVGWCSDFQDRTSLRMAGGTHRLDVTMQGFWPYATYCSPAGGRAVLEIQLSPRSTGAEP